CVRLDTRHCIINPSWVIAFFLNFRCVNAIHDVMSVGSTKHFNTIVSIKSYNRSMTNQPYSCIIYVGQLQNFHVSDYIFLYVSITNLIPPYC
ncbi:hypothetical protein L9F63_024946, partial [Diploptera punctata]